MSLTGTTTQQKSGDARRRGGSILAVVGLAAVSALILSGCSAAGSSSADNTVSFLSWENATTMKPVIAEFEKENPTITVKMSYAPPVPQYISKLQTELGSGTGPDVFIITAENKVQLEKDHFVKDLSNESFVSNIASKAKETYTKDGKLYGIATSSWGGGILINKDLLAKVGYTQAPTTWDEFLALCKKLKAAGITPFYEGGDGISVSLAALLGIQNASLGGTMDADIWAGKTTFEKTWTKPLETFNQLFTQEIEPRSVAGLTGDNVNQQFEKGSVAMITTGSWGLGAITAAAPNLKLDFIAVAGASSSYWAGAVSPGYAINAKTQHTAAAVKLLTFLQSPKGVEVFQKQTAAITTTKNYTPTLDAALSTMVPAVRAGDFYLPQVSWPDNSAAMGTEATALLQQMIQGQITPKQVAQGLDKKLASLRSNG
jgi:raffinose/stachyose/melibiose transport system substrate-binding protein